MMYLKRLINLSVVLMLILGMFFIVKPVNAQETIEDNIEVDFEIEFKTATDLKVRITADVLKIYLSASGTTYLKEDIQAVSSDLTMGAIEYVLKSHLTDQIKQTFINADITTGELPTYDKNYFYDEYDVNLTSAFFSMADTIDAHDFINGVLDMGAIVNYSFNLQADPGWNNSYIFNLGSSLTYFFDEVNTGLINGNKVEWKVINGNGNAPYETAIIKLKKNNPTTHDLKSENISLNFILNSTNVDSTNLVTNILIENVDILVYNVLPSFIEKLNFMPADGFRLFVNNSLITWYDVYNTTIRPIEEKIKDKIENSSFNQTLDLIHSWDNLTTTNCPNPYSIQKMDSSPLIRSMLIDSDINLKMCDISNRAFFGLINAGAQTNITDSDINFGDNLDEIGYDYNFTLYLPKNMYLDGKNVYEWNESVSTLGEFKSDDANSFTKEKKETVIEIEIQSTDLNILSFFTGKTEFTFGLKMQEKREYNVTSIPNMFNLPDKLILSYLCSDAFRVCVEENVFSQTDVDNYLDSERKLFENRLVNILPSLDVENKGNIKRDVFDESLNAWDKDISNMDANTALKIDAYAHTSHPITFGLSFLPPSFTVSKQYLNFTGIKDHNVTYRVIFPNDISIKISDSLGKAAVKTKSDGRKYIEISFNESECNLSDTVTCTIMPSALFIFVLLLPCIISFILVIILIIVIILIRRKRKTRPAKSKSSSDEDETDYVDYSTTAGYENEDYYVPPAPESKQKKSKK